MGAMYRLKAYFGMVPAEDMAEYADEPPVERYAGRRRDDRRATAVAPTRLRARGVTSASTSASPRSQRSSRRRPLRYDDWDRRPRGSRAARSRWSARARWSPGWTASPCGAGPAAGSARPR